MIEIRGTVQDGYGKVADAFAENFENFPEVGASFALYVDGALRVDVHAGIADQASGRPWTDDTLQLVFSTTKGVAAICVARLVAAGALDYDEPVATYWPEFAAHGKDRVTLGQLMSHQAGLPCVETAHPRRPARRRAGRHRARRPSATVGAGHRSRVPRLDLRVARR